MSDRKRIEFQDREARFVRRPDRNPRHPESCALDDAEREITRLRQALSAITTADPDMGYAARVAAAALQDSRFAQ